MESIFDWSVILSIVGVLVVLTNIIAGRQGPLYGPERPPQGPSRPGGVKIPLPL